MRRVPFLAVLVALLAGAAPAAAQYVYFYPEKTYGWGADTAFHVPAGGTERLQLYGNVSGGVSSYSVTVYVDTVRLRIVGVDSVPGSGLPAPTITREAADRITLTATGPGYGFGTGLAMLVIEAVPGATVGSLFSLRVNSWLTQAGASVDPRTIRTEVENGCIAQALWGDPDASLTVTGRDALIALTSAVGLPVSGFDLTLADVDDDLVVTSRDALLMLAYAIDATYYYYYYNSRAGVPRANRCAPLAGVPSDMAFLRGTAAGNLYRVPAGDTIAVPVGSQTAFYRAHRVRWLPDGTKILATASTSPYYYEPIAVTLATLVQDTLARNSAYDGGGAYSPNGTQIAFFSDRASPYLWLMGADGSNPVQAQTVNTVTNYQATSPAWHPNAATPRVAFTGYPVGSGTNGLWSLRVDSGPAAVRLEFPASASYPPLHPAWSPAGDSLLFQANNRVYAVAAPDTATVPREAVSLSGTLDWPSWTSAGVIVRRWAGLTYDYYLRRNDGRIVRIFRAAGYYDEGASFR